MFKRLLLVLGFAVLSIAQHTSFTEFRYQKYSTENDVVTFDETSDDAQYTYVKIDDYKLLKAGQNENSTSFRLVPEDVLPDLKVSQRFGFNLWKCQTLDDSIYDNLYYLYGLAAYVYGEHNITPSIVYALESAPKDVKRKTSSGTESFEVGCNSPYEYYALGFEQNGIVSGECVSNNKVLPGHEDAEGSEVMDDAPTKCEGSDTAIEGVLKGYKLGRTINNQYIIGTDYIKRYLTRVGPIAGQIRYSGEVPAVIERGLVIGWESNEWILATPKNEPLQDGYRDIILEEKRIDLFKSSASLVQAAGYVLFDKDNLVNPGDTPGTGADVDCSKDITKDTPKETCSCPDKTDKAKWDADPRTKTKGDICASGSMRVLLNVIAAAVVIPFLFL